MAEGMWVDQVRRLLDRAKTQKNIAFPDLNALKDSIDGALALVPVARGERQLAMCSSVIPYPVQRRNLLAQIARHGRFYGLSDEIQAFVYAAGAQVIQELDNDQLAALHGWLVRWVDDMQTGCDSAWSPPAR